MKEVSRCYQLGDDLLVEVFTPEGGRVSFVTAKNVGQEENFLEHNSEIILRIAKLIREVDDNNSKRYRPSHICVDHGYHENYECEKCHPVDKETATQ